MLILTREDLELTIINVTAVIVGDILVEKEGEGIARRQSITIETADGETLEVRMRLHDGNTHYEASTPFTQRR